MDNSLFQIQQLTEFREWSDGRKGCLLYVPNPIDYNDIYGGAVYLIDSSFRKILRHKKFNTLRTSEITKLNDSNRIVAGFGALILSAVANDSNWGDSYSQIQELWDEYQEPLIMYETEMHIILYQCELWMKRQENIYSEFLNKHDAYNRIHQSVKNALIRALIKAINDEDESNLSGFTPHVKIEDKELPHKNIQYASYYYGDKSFRLSEDTNIQIFGYTARVINHALKRYVGNAFIDADTFENAIHILYDTLTGVPENLSFKDIVFRWKTALRNSEQPRYIEKKEERVRNYLATEDEYMLASKEKQDKMVIDYIFQNELEYFNLNNPILKYFSKEQMEMIIAQVRDFFMILLTRLKGSAYYAKRLNNIENLFGSIISEHQPVEQFTKFRYILSDEKEKIIVIHKRIELYLNSPSKLRDELKKLNREHLVSLPIDNPTEIIREVNRIWGEKTLNERSFVTTWGRN